MKQPSGSFLPSSDSTNDLLADWNVEQPSQISAPGLSVPGGKTEECPITTTTVHRPIPTADRSWSESRGFLEGFHLGEPGENDSLSRPGWVGIEDGITVLRRDRPACASRKTPSGMDWHRGISTGGGLDRRPSRDLPKIGDVLAGFRILQELGRGAFARVYLAEEIHLGWRLVAIKVSRAEGDEPRILARLQHTNIVPVHSVCDDPETGLRVLCMPFFGGANLAQVLDTALGLANAGRTGRSLVEALDQISQHQLSVTSEAKRPLSGGERFAVSVGGNAAALSGPAEDLSHAAGVSSVSNSALMFGFRSLLSRMIRSGATPTALPDAALAADDPHQPSRQFLRKATVVQAAVWIVARLTEGLDHAHSRGLLHRDLKPANILIAEDGTPMLLDFNLAAESRPRSSEGEIGRAMVGGTLPYMAPEHLDAFSLRGTTAADVVDERSDIYAMGLILFEMLAGEHPFPTSLQPPGISPTEMIAQMIEARRRTPSLRVQCPQVPWSLDALVAKCLSFEPGRRYTRARDLAEDLRRFLDDLPMKHAPEPSVRERAGKFARRHKVFCSSTSIAVISLVFIIALATVTTVVYSGMQGLVARFQRQAFERSFTEAQFLLNTAGLSDRHLASGLNYSQRLLERLNLSADRDHPIGWFRSLTSAEQQRTREQIVELIILEARARVLLASRRGTESDRRRAIQRAIVRLDLAERLADHAPAALFSERARYDAALGDVQRADHDRGLADLAQPASCHDWTLLGTSLLAAGNPAAAEDAFRHALRLDCTSFWAWFMMGHCHYAQGRFLEAAGDFAACTAHGSQFAWVHFNRGLALARAGLLDSARDAYDHALGLDPGFAEALVNRALVELELNQVEPALSDLSQAVTLGRNDTAVLAARGEALARLGRAAEARLQFDSLLTTDPDNAVVRAARGMTQVRTDPHSARHDFERVLRLDPRHSIAHYGMALLVRADDPRAALGHLDIAIDSDPHLIDAIQLRALVRARLGDPAALDDVDRLLKIPTAQRYYNAACAVAVYAEKAGEPRQLEHAMELLTRAVDLGFPAAEAVDDPDLACLRDRPAYRRLKAKG
jgi:eukaryotic-like serine/threonine-protein kinase